LRRWVADAAGHLGGLDIFVANVSALAQAMDEESWRRSVDIDILGTIAGVEAAIPLLERSAAGSIVVIGTTGAIEIAGAPRPYASVKAALVPYVKALARNLAAKGVRANMVSPGNVYFKGGYGAPSKRTARRCSRRCCRVIRWAAWAHHRKWRTPSFFSPVHAPALSPAPT
jgi:NAD(P)-dependent dehydrogenase (short-subunit alcohol dehydrogenase family)